MFVDFEAYVAVVRALRYLRVRKLVAAFQILDEANERFILVRAAESFPDIFIGYGFLGEGVNGGEYAANHVNRVRCKRDLDGLCCKGVEFLFHFAYVAMHDDLVGANAAEPFRMMRGNCGFAAASAAADFEVNNYVFCVY